MSVTVQRFMGRLLGSPDAVADGMLAAPGMALAQVGQPGAAPGVRGGEADLVLPGSLLRRLSRCRTAARC